jgi:hypothetical protein
MSYLINGIALDNSAKLWSMLAGSKMRSEGSRSVLNVPVQGRDGVIAGLPADAGPAPLTLVVDTPAADFGALFTLVSYGGNLSTTECPGRVAVFEYLSHSVAEDLNDNAWLQVTFILRVPGTYWRDVAEVTSTSAAISSGAHNHDVLPSLSAPVPDAMVKIKGAVTGLQVTDSRGSWFSYSGSLTTAQWLRFESDSGRAYVTTTDVWTGGTEVSGDVDFGGPRGVFEITPAWTSDPSVRVGRLTVATATRTSAAVQVRGRAAYVI